MKNRHRRRQQHARGGAASRRTSLSPSTVQAFSHRLQVLEKAFNTNTKVFSDGMQMLEAQDAVARQIMQDMLSGNVRLIVDPTTDATGSVRGSIDFNGYLKSYIEELVRREEMQDAEAQEVQRLLVTQDEDAPIIFGGTGS